MYLSAPARAGHAGRVSGKLLLHGQIDCRNLQMHELLQIVAREASSMLSSVGCGVSSAPAGHGPTWRQLVAAATRLQPPGLHGNSLLWPDYCPAITKQLWNSGKPCSSDTSSDSFFKDTCQACGMASQL